MIRCTGVSLFAGILLGIAWLPAAGVIAALLLFILCRLMSQQATYAGEPSTINESSSYSSGDDVFGGNGGTFGGGGASGSWDSDSSSGDSGAGGDSSGSSD